MGFQATRASGSEEHRPDLDPGAGGRQRRSAIPRRAALQALALLAVAPAVARAQEGPLLPGPPNWVPSRPVARSASIGQSGEARALRAYVLGAGPRVVLLVGGLHAGTEANTVVLAEGLLGHFRDQPGALPPWITLGCLPVANPDGLARKTREAASGVDLNRNWPTADWTANATGNSARRRPGGGGPAPLSEPETAALAAWIAALKPAAVVSFHSAGALVVGGSLARERGLVAAYNGEARYPADRWTGYAVTGDLVGWCEESGTAAMDVELTDHEAPELERNLAGVFGLFGALR